VSGRPRVPLVVVAVALAVAACLPASVRPATPPPATPTPVPTATPVPTGTPEPTPTPGPSFATYTVGRGDTLTSIARRFKTTARSIAYWNRDQYKSLDPEAANYRPDSIQRGWVLRILPNQEYVPPPDDGETGEQATPTPDDSEDYEPLPSDAAP
jgi:nucleoid-associated protein YgaU